MISLDLRDMIVRYIYNEITREQLEDWIVPKLPYFLALFDSTDADIISAVELGLAEISNGNWTEGKFRNYLEEALQELVLMVQISATPDIQTTSRSSNKTTIIHYLSPAPEPSIVLG